MYLDSKPGGTRGEMSLLFMICDKPLNVPKIMCCKSIFEDSVTRRLTGELSGKFSPEHTLKHPVVGRHSCNLSSGEGNTGDFGAPCSAAQESTWHGKVRERVCP